MVADVFGMKNVEAWLVHQWYFCTGQYMFQEPHDGVEIAADGKWYFLDHVGDKLVRRQGFSGGGDWSMYDTSGVNGPGPLSVQVNLDRWQGGGLGGFPRFATSPLKVNLNFGGAGPAEYIAVAP